MSALHDLFERIRTVVFRRREEAELAEELRFHLEMEASRREAEGIAPAEALRQSRRALGGVERTKDDVRDARGTRAVDAMFAQPAKFAASVVYAVKSLRRRPAFFVIAVSSLAIALGLATTVIAEIDSLRHPSLGTPYDDRLFMGGLSGKSRTTPSDDELLAEVRRTGLVEDAAISRVAMRADIEFGTLSSSQMFRYVQPHFFDIMGVRPLIGRWFHADETAESGVAIVTEDAWRQRLGAPPTLESARLVVNGRRYAIVGVAPNSIFMESRLQNRMQHGAISNFSVSSGVVLPSPAIWPDTGMIAAQFMVLAKHGVGRSALNKALPAITERLSREHGAAPQPFRGSFIPLAWNGPFALALDGLYLAMTGAIFFIVLIACANVSALMLARSVARRRDHALRLALGARGSDVMRDVAAEVLIIAVAGGIAGLLVGDLTMHILVAVTPPDLPWLGFRDPHWNIWVFLDLFAVVLAVVMVAAFLPAKFVSRIAPAEQLKAESGTTTGRPNRNFQLLVMGELALSMILMFGSVLVARSADAIGRYDFGYDVRGVAEVHTEARIVDSLPKGRNVEAWKGPDETRFRLSLVTPETMDNIVRRIGSAPDVANAAWCDEIDARVVTSDATLELLGSQAYNVGAGFLATLGIPIVDGRDFVETDRTTRGAVILDRMSAGRLFPDGHAVGKLVKLGAKADHGAWMTVVGIAGNAIHELPDDPAVSRVPVIYVSRSPVGGYAPSFVVRARRGVKDVRPEVAAIVMDLMPPHTSFTATKWVAKFEQFLLIRKFTAGLFLTLSLASLVLAAAGLFGVLSYAVNQRMREFAVRVALGATQKHMVQLVVRDGLVMVLGGTAIGGAVAMYGAFSMWQWLWGVYPVDAAALLISDGVLIAIMVVTVIVPASRATRANPVDVMRAT